RLGHLRQLELPVDDRLRDVDDAAALGARMGAQALERGALVDAVALHQDALRALDRRAADERALELVDLRLQPCELGMAAQRDLDRALHRLRHVGARLRGDAAIGGARDEVGVVLQRERDYRAGRVGADLLDQRERMVVVAVQHDHRDVRIVARDLLGNVGDLDRIGADGMAELAQQAGEPVERTLILVGDEHAQTLYGHGSSTCDNPAQERRSALRSSMYRRGGATVRTRRPSPPALQATERREVAGIVADEDVRSKDERGHPGLPVYPRNAGPGESLTGDGGQTSGAGASKRSRAERDAMVERHLGLARHLALRYSDSGEPLDDLFQVASLGLINAVDRFDPTRGIAFTTFAVPTILGELKRHFRDRGWAIHVPRDLKDASLRVRRAIAEHHGERPPTPAELAQATGLSLEGVLEALEVAGVQRALSLDAPASTEEGGATLVDLIGADDADLARAHDRTLLEALMRTVTPREREILRLRFVEDLTQSQIGERIGVSQMQVSRILRGALARMREAARAGDEPTGANR